MQYLFARAYAEKYGHAFQCQPWIGQEIFDLDDEPIDAIYLPQRTEFTAKGEGDICFRDFYAQSQAAMIYTRRKAKEWLRIRPELLPYLNSCTGQQKIVAHRRVGDYKNLNYPVVSAWSIEHACWQFGLNHSRLKMVTEESPTIHPAIPERIAFASDFYLMMTASVLIRGNSSFSWLAGILSDALLLSPIVDGLRGGEEHDVVYVAGSWPRFCSLDFVTNLYLPE